VVLVEAHDVAFLVEMAVHADVVDGVIGFNGVVDHDGKVPNSVREFFVVLIGQRFLEEFDFAVRAELTVKRRDPSNGVQEEFTSPLVRSITGLTHV